MLKLPSLQDGAVIRSRSRYAHHGPEEKNDVTGTPFDAFAWSTWQFMIFSRCRDGQCGNLNDLLRGEVLKRLKKYHICISSYDI